MYEVHSLIISFKNYFITDPYKKRANCNQTRRARKRKYRTKAQQVINRDWRNNLLPSK